jgi:hypothetical protein
LSPPVVEALRCNGDVAAQRAVQCDWFIRLLSLCRVVGGVDRTAVIGAFAV